MERIFWVACPECSTRFYASHRELREAAVELFCPSCRARFRPEAAAELDEREKPARP